MFPPALRREKNCLTLAAFPPFGDPWPSCLSPSQYYCWGFCPCIPFPFAPLILTAPEGGNRTGSILKAGLHLGPDCGL